MKRMISLMLSLLLVICLFPATAFAASDAMSGSCGGNLTWMLDSTTGQLTISGSGDMSSAPWSKDLVHSIVFSGNITSICDNAFSRCYNLTTISLPNTVTSIGEDAFFLSGLTSVVVPDSVTFLGESAFDYCTSLTKAVIGSGVTTIIDNTFENCSSLTEITIPKSVTAIGDDAFYNCPLETMYYTGSEPQWGLVSIAGGNSSLLTAEHIYASRLQVKWDPSHTVLNISGMVDGSAYVTAAFYNTDGQMQLVKHYTAAQVFSGVDISDSTVDLTQCTATVMILDEAYAPVGVPYTPDAANPLYTASHLFTTTKSYAKIAGEDYTYEMDVLIDGVERTIATNETIVKFLAANKNKLFHVEFQRYADEDYYGYVEEVRLINEFEDIDDTFSGCNYLNHDVTVTVSSLICGGESFRYDANTKVYGKIDSVEVLDQDTADDYSIWVIADEDSPYARADVIYVGTKLSDDTTAKINGAEAVENAFEVIAGSDVVIDVANNNTLIEMGEEIYAGDLTIKTIAAGTYTFKVYAEDGCCVSEEYTLKVLNLYLYLNEEIYYDTSTKENIAEVTFPDGTEDVIVISNTDTSVLTADALYAYIQDTTNGTYTLSRVEAAEKSASLTVDVSTVPHALVSFAPAAQEADELIRGFSNDGIYVKRGNKTYLYDLADCIIAVKTITLQQSDLDTNTVSVTYDMAFYSIDELKEMASIFNETEIDTDIFFSDFTYIAEELLYIEVYALKDYDDTDAWGRPGYGYKHSTSDKYTFTAKDPAAVYSVAISELLVSAVLDKNETFELTVYTNGKDTTEEFNPISTVNNLGAQGTLVEVYDGALVIIDNYLGKVTKNVDATYDATGHKKRDAYSEVTVWMDENGESTSIEVAGIDYAKDTWVIVNYNEAEDYFEIACEAESFVGAQDKIWYNVTKHTIDGEDYMDAVHFYMDEAGIHDAKYTWFLDPYGNLIGSLEIEPTYNHAVLKDLIWIIGKPGYAEATLLYMDGTEETVVAVTADEPIFSDNETHGFGWSDDIELELDDDKNFEFGEVSSETMYNEDYLGYALYKIEHNEDGSVNLHGAMDDEIAVHYTTNATIDISASVIQGDVGMLYIDTATEFLIRELDNDGEYTYTAYDLDSLPVLVNNAEIFYMLNSKGIVNRVYVKNASVEAAFGTHLFTTTRSYSVKIGDIYTYEMDVLIDGVERTIATNEEIVEYLAANKNKLFHVEFETYAGADYYGYVTEVRLINEFEDDDDTFEGSCDFLNDDVTVTVSSLINDGTTYRYDAETIVYGEIESVEELDQDVADDYSLWVICDQNSRYDRADVIYVGTKLSDDTTAKVNGAEAVEYVFEVIAGSDVVIDVKNDNTLIEMDGDISAGDLAIEAIAAGTYAFTIYAEDGCCESREYTLKVVVPANVYEYKLVKTTMDAENGAELVIELYKNGEQVKIESELLNAAGCEVVLFNENGDMVYSTEPTAEPSEDGNAIVITTNNTLTAGKSYKAVAKIVYGVANITGTVESAYIQAQTTVGGEAAAE